MKQSLQLKVGQQLTMTPQLQQAIRLLQLSTLDLQQEIQSALDSNPLLEIGEDDTPEGEPAQQNTPAAAPESTTAELSQTEETKETSASSDDSWAERSEIPEDLPVDSQWDDVYLFDESWAFREDRARHLYTAVTRAAERITVVR